ncbi:AraC family transcriptional regulator [Paenibacillus sp. YN15]|uniref:helix-turn-helix transcriptional regulator n=1 Tax=Paenibacillus sp. YN15 TaxID=1742774 RepID=UPI000DCB3537|nr:AraC family transcriptional regulator [Paenibacillus sp. YN15]RAV05517.1 AraC family transcriptional regulator [Paenibacillus sp. YN15]
MAEHRSEHIVYGNPLQPVRVLHEFRNERVAGEWHYHHELELIAIVRGEFSIYTKDKVFHLSAGDVAIIGSFEPHHSFKEEGVMEYIVLQFDIFKFLGQDMVPYMKYFTEAGRLYSKLNSVFAANPEVKNQVFAHIHEIAAEYTRRQKGYEIAIHSLICRIILVLLRNDASFPPDAENDGQRAKLVPVLDYIEKNISGRIDMKEAAQMMNLDYFYFGKVFKRIMGKTFIEHVNSRRIANAELILLTRDVSVLETASLVGMPNMTNFYKIFHKYNKCSPKEFRKRLLCTVKS